MANLPLAYVRLVLLTLTSSLCLVSFAANVNGLVKGDDYTNKAIKAGAAIGTTVYIDNSQIKNPGYVEATGIGLLGLTAFFSSLLLFRDKFLKSSSSSVPVSTSTLVSQGGVMLLWALLAFGSGVVTTYRIATKEGKVTAFIGSLQIPDSVVRETEKIEGFSRVYWDRDYLRFTAIAVWPALFFGLLAIIVTFIANARKSDDTTTNPTNIRNDSFDNSETSSTEKV